MPILAEIRVIPIATPSTSLSKYIAEVLKIIEKHGIKYILTPFGTCVEVPSFDVLTNILAEVTELMRGLGVDRFMIDLAIDVRFDKELTLDSKIKSVEERLAKDRQAV